MKRKTLTILRNKISSTYGNLKADILYPCNRSLVFKFGTSAQLLSSQYSPSGSNISNRFNTSTKTTKTSGVTPIVYTVAQGKISKFRYSAGLNWQLNHIGFSDLTSNIHEHNNQLEFQSYYSDNDAIWKKERTQFDA